MNSEKFNINITTPEGEEKDPELKRLRAELMTFKQPLEDAIAKKDLPKAEELHAKALEAKAKLEAYKESLNKKEEYPTIEINGVKVELGPELGEMSWDEIPAKLEEFNKTLKPGEKPWRVPTKKEFDKVNKLIIEIDSDNSLAEEEREIKIKKKFEYLGYSRRVMYWSSTVYNAFPRYVFHWNTISRKVQTADRHYKHSVRLVR